VVNGLFSRRHAWFCVSILSLACSDSRPYGYLVIAENEQRFGLRKGETLYERHRDEIPDSVRGLAYRAMLGPGGRFSGWDSACARYFDHGATTVVVMRTSCPKDLVFTDAFASLVVLRDRSGSLTAHMRDTSSDADRLVPFSRAKDGTAIW
jgi:hypothetical protein